MWSVTSFSELRREGAAIARHNLFSPTKTPTLSYVEQCLQPHDGPVIAATDYVSAYSDLIRPYIHRTYVTLGTDGFGRSDTRARLRQFFEVDRFYVAVAALSALPKDGKIAASEVTAAMKNKGLIPINQIQ